MLSLFRNVFVIETKTMIKYIANSIFVVEEYVRDIIAEYEVGYYFSDTLIAIRPRILGAPDLFCRSMCQSFIYCSFMLNIDVRCLFTYPRVPMQECVIYNPISRL
jgi:hypothetical protein